MIKLIIFFLLITPVYACPMQELTPDMKIVIGKMEKEAGCKVRIFSGKRSKKHNNKVGGALNSNHLDGNAIDFAFVCWSINGGAKIAKKYCRGTGIYPRHIHCDMRDDKKVVWRGNYK